MRLLLFLTEWALRSSVLILCGAGLLWMLRVKDAFIRLSAWIALLVGSLAIPVLTMVFPAVSIAVLGTDAAMNPRVIAVPTVAAAVPEVVHAAGRHFDWARIAMVIYGAVVLLLLLRLLIGVLLSRRLLRDTLTTDRMFRESDRVAAPVTLGIVRPVLVLPGDWREWQQGKLDAVLAHERSHIRRHDPAIQMLSAIHRALLWITPLSWFLHNRIVRTAEEASDDAAVAASGDRTFYAEVLLGFVQRAVRGTSWLGVPMARHERPDRRIRRILEGTPLSPTITRWALAVIMTMVPLLAYLLATAHPSQAAPEAPGRSAPAPARSVPPAPVPTTRARTRQRASVSSLGLVSATTVKVTALVDGQLASVGPVEGRAVKVGELLATIESPQLRAQFDRATNQLSEDQKVHAEAAIPADEAAVAEARRLLAYDQVRAPISGIAGLREIDPGNFVHAGDTLLVITQLHPIAVVFSIPEDDLPRVQALLRSGAAPVVEVSNRSDSARLATGRLTALDNEIDAATGTIKVKASVDNGNGALFPNQFVNVRLLLGAR